MDRIVSVWARSLEIIHSKSTKNAACRKCLFTPLPGLAQISLSSVGADASVRPPMLYRTSCKRCHCETSSQTGRGERAERCQWQKKRGERVAAVKILSVRRKAAQKFWAPQQDHRPLRSGWFFLQTACGAFVFSLYTNSALCLL